MIPQEAALDGNATVNEVIKRHPATAAVFLTFGIDACCGGALTLQDAASRHHKDIIDVLTALETTIGANARP